MRIQTLRSTIAKKEPIDSTLLADNLERVFEQDWVCPVEKILGRENNHVEVRLGFNSGDWWFYEPHVNIFDTQPVLEENKSLAQKIVDCCVERGYPLRRGVGQINIVGIEGMDIDGNINNDAIDKWNDALFLLEFQSGRPVIIFKAQCTTEPGQYYTNKPLNPNGAARLDTGYHKDLWQFGQHRGYYALVQGDNTARLVRDRNRNHRRDDAVSHERWRGVNLHTTKTTGWRGSASSGTIGLWSAGCVVVYRPADFTKMMKIITDSVEFKADKNRKYDFILLWGKWLNEEVKSVGNLLFDSEDMDVLARTIWGEARGESLKGKQAVAWIVRNRIAHSPKYGWGDTAAKVCKQPWQFSCWNKNDPNYNQLISLNIKEPAYLECLEIATKVFEGEIPDVTNGADHYYADYIAPPEWAIGQSPVAQIGTHIFLDLVK